MYEWLMDVLFSHTGLKILQWVGGVAGAAFGVYVLGRVNQPWLRGILQRLWQEFKATSEDVYTAYTIAYRRAAADGVVTPEEEQGARQSAIDAAKKHFSGKLGVAHLVRIVLGISLDAWLEGNVQKTLAEAKEAGEKAVAADPHKGLAEVIDIKEIK